jgi:hypothetical protein
MAMPLAAASLVPGSTLQPLPAPAGDDEVDVSPEEEAALAAFMAPGAADYQQRSLADMILGKIREQQAEAGVAVIPE